MMTIHDLMEIACFIIEERRISGNEYQIVVKLKRKDNDFIIGITSNTINISETNEKIESSKSHISVNEVDWEDLISETKIMLVNHMLLIFKVENFYIEKLKDIGGLTCDHTY